MQEQGHFDQHKSRADGRLVIGTVGDAGGAVAGYDIRDHVKGNEGGPDASWVEGTEIRHVVQSTAENEIIGTVVDWWCDEEDNMGADEDAQIVVVVRAVFAETEAHDEERRRPWEEEAYTPRAVFDIVLPDVEDAGDKEEDGKYDGDAFRWRIDVIGAWD